jgi:hypothetical protein
MFLNRFEDLDAVAMKPLMVSESIWAKRHLEGILYFLVIR